MSGGVLAKLCLQAVDAAIKVGAHLRDLLGQRRDQLRLMVETGAEGFGLMLQTGTQEFCLVVQASTEGVCLVVDAAGEVKEYRGVGSDEDAQE